MSKFSIPGMDGSKTAVAGWGLLVIGVSAFLTQLADFLSLLGRCMTGEADLLTVCATQLPLLGLGAVIALCGLLGLGLGHKLESIKKALEA